MGIDISNHKLMYHPKRVYEWNEKGDCYPIYVEIGLTNLCNHKCIFCALDFLKHEGNFIDREVMLKALKEMGEKGVKSIMFAGEGES
ncbi:MAG: radical SAM protein, partial [Nanoarchaeota archaeon]|nr:radical SAM protein [Nanoarchaeota archaeon]